MNSVSKAMMAERDNLSTTTCRMKIAQDDQNHDLPSVTQSTAFQNEKLDDPKTTWTSSISSLIQSVTQGAYDTLDCVTRNPNRTMAIGAVLLYQVTAVAACYCTCLPDPSQEKCAYIGPSGDNASCARECRYNYFKYSICTN